MATFRMPIGSNLLPEVGVFPDRVGNQISAETAPSVGSQMCLVMADGGSDEGFYCDFDVPENYVGTPEIRVKGILDGAPGASDVLGFGVRGMAVANNETADGTYNSEDVASATIGSSGTNHSDEDEYVDDITLSNIGTIAADDSVRIYFYIDSSVTSYAGNFLLTGLFFQYSDS